MAGYVCDEQEFGTSPELFVQTRRSHVAGRLYLVVMDIIRSGPIILKYGQEIPVQASTACYTRGTGEDRRLLTACSPPTSSSKAGRNMQLTDIGNPLVFFTIIGFLAQLVDGAIGMAYGVLSTTLLIFLGVSPLHASASVKAAEFVTTGVSGAAHHLVGNVERRLVLQLIVPGVIGGVLGAYILTRIDGNVIKPYISAYLVVMGIVIVLKALRARQERSVPARVVAPLALSGGFFDAVGGGGWGPIVTTNLVAMGHCPRASIGSVNAAEFFVTMAQAATFIVSIGIVMWQVSAGLLLGGVLAAPLAALVCRRLPRRVIMTLVGVLICVISSVNILKACL